VSWPLGGGQKRGHTMNLPRTGKLQGSRNEKSAFRVNKQWGNNKVSGREEKEYRT